MNNDPIQVGWKRKRPSVKKLEFFLSHDSLRFFRITFPSKCKKDDRRMVKKFMKDRREERYHPKVIFREKEDSLKSL